MICDYSSIALRLCSLCFRLDCMRSLGVLDRMNRMHRIFPLRGSSCLPCNYVACIASFTGNEKTFHRFHCKGFTGFARITFGKGERSEVILLHPVDLIDRSRTLEDGKKLFSLWHDGVQESEVPANGRRRRQNPVNPVNPV